METPYEPNNSGNNNTPSMEQMNFLGYIHGLEEPDISLEMIQRQLRQRSSMYESTIPSSMEVHGEGAPFPPLRSRVIPWLMTADSSPEPPQRQPSISSLTSGQSNYVMTDPAYFQPQNLETQTLNRGQSFEGSTINLTSNEDWVSEFYQAQNPSVVSIDTINREISSQRIRRPYPKEQIHFIRYLKEDLNLAWAEVNSEFNRLFRHQPEFILRETVTALASKSYRDNHVYAHTNWILDVDEKGAPIRVPARVRSRSIGENREYPFKLVEKHPSWAVTYSWVLPQHRAQAQAILDGSDPEYYNSPKDRHRRLIEQAEIIEGNLLHRSTRTG